ncbi:2-oxoglutarate and iron-dependent oxygenase domain-containing protein 2-like isoform X3 [Panulirus ornatus]|uniref:2-oxoglutarate and iron-dependent oxygenase domain-containing protein 2-like isoform X3 n=1 Tax=Panulirus ornatus TaxID=150431 RepID=UPI003A8A6E78
MVVVRWCVCRCYLSHNIFLHQYNLHVTYRDKAQFLHQYYEALLSRGCGDPESLISEVESESIRRKQLLDDSLNRRMLIAKEYKPLHPQIFTFQIKLEEIGFDDFISGLRSTYLTPLTRLLYPDWGGSRLDSHKAFIVKYKEGEDVDLDYHYDNAEVTLNVSLNEDYTDGELYFGPMRNEVSSQRLGYTHHIGRGLLHRGQQLHGALPISEGVRYNLIIWMRSSQVRNELCPMCDEKPVLVPVKHGFGDGFTETTADVCCTA